MKASKELADIEPVVARIGDLRAAERAARRCGGAARRPRDARTGGSRTARAEGAHSRRCSTRSASRCCRRMRPTSAPPSWKCAPPPAATRRRCSPPSCSGCTSAMRNSRGWRWEILEYNDTELGGLKEGIAEITGRGVFARLKYESGVHRVQRVPTTESQGRIHTSTVTVAVLPEAEEVDVQIDETICASTSTAPRAPAASTSTRPKARCASRTCPPASWWRCRRKRASTRTAPRR